MTVAGYSEMRDRQKAIGAVCGKRAFVSLRAARDAHRRAGWRLRVYRCPDCGLLHVTNAEKATRRYRPDR